MVDATLERCPVCGGAFDAQVPYPAPPKERALFSVTQIALCGSCGLGAAIPVPQRSVVDDYYATGIYRQSIEDSLERAHERCQSLLRVQRLLPYLNRGSPLAVAETGAGYGGIPRALARLGVNLSHYVFVEPDERAARVILDLSLPFPCIRVSSPADFPALNDVLFVNHVLEHVTEPVGFLQSVLAAVSPGGFAYIETPHSDYRFKNDVFPHLLFFTRDSLLRLGDCLGVSTVACEAFGREPAARWTPMGLMQRLAARGFRASVQPGWTAMQVICDRIVWRYAPVADGIWLRWILRKKIL